jgi:hypothetical protein
MAIRDFIKGALKVALGIFIAVVGLAGASWGVWALWNAKEKQEAKQYEVVKAWQSDLKQYLKMDLVARTKVVDGQLMTAVEIEGFPDFLSHPKIGRQNFDRNLTLIFVDSDGFEVYRKELKISDFTSIVDSQGKKSGMQNQFTEFLEVAKYKSFARLRVQWNLVTEIPAEASPPPVAKPTNPLKLQDHCAPGLSRVERLRRLAQYGTVREVGYGRFTAGSREINFVSADELYSCK